MSSFFAFFLRELRAAVVGRFLHIFWLVVLVAGFIPVIAEPSEGGGDATAYTLLQFCLYIIPLFALLTGIGSAQNEVREQSFLLSQPISSGGRVIGKFMALWAIIGVAVFVLVLPTAIWRTGAGGLWFLWQFASAAGGIFGALGLAVGFSTSDQVKAYMWGLCVWLILLAGVDLIALITARSGFAANYPQLWLSLLMGNPLDALRISALLEFERIPFDFESAPAIGRWWLASPGIWYGLLSGLWILSSLMWARYRIERR